MIQPKQMTLHIWYQRTSAAIGQLIRHWSAMQHAYQWSRNTQNFHLECEGNQLFVTMVHWSIPWIPLNQLDMFILFQTTRKSCWLSSAIHDLLIPCINSTTTIFNSSLRIVDQFSSPLLVQESVGLLIQNSSLKFCFFNNYSEEYCATSLTRFFCCDL